MSRIHSSVEARLARMNGESLHVWLLTLLALVQIAVFLAIVPPWQHYDEPAHFRFAWSRVHLDSQQGDRFFTPIDPEMVRETLSSMVQYGFYETLPSPNYLRTYALDTLGHSQSGEFPLYYDLLRWPLQLLRHTDVTTQLQAARFLTGLFYLAMIWACIGTMRCLVPPGHELRWLIPACVALVAPLADIFTAVNNDAAAITGFTFFLWGGVHALTHRLNWLHFIWLAAAMAFAVIAKQALVFAAPLLPLVLLMSLWRRQGWPSYQVWVISGVGIMAAAVIGLRIESAAYWTVRWPGDEPSRVRTRLAVHGDHAMAALVNYETLYQRLPSRWVQDHPEHLVNFGAWVWSDQPVQVPLLGFAYVAEDANFMFTEVLRAPAGEEELEVGPDPQFVSRQFWVPREAEILYVFLWPYTLVHQETPNHVYYDGLVLMEGVADLTQEPAYVNGNPKYVRWGDRESRNLVRNASAEAPWPNVHRPYEKRLQEIANWSMTSVIHRILDPQWSGKILWIQQPKFMAINLFNRMAWGGVNLPGAFWGPLTLALSALGLAGCGWRARRALLQERTKGGQPDSNLPFIFLGLSLLLIWMGADLWIVQFMWMDNLHLSDIRYTFPVILVTVGMMVMGLRQLSLLVPVLGRSVPWILISIFLAFDLAAMWAYLDAFAF